LVNDIEPRLRNIIPQAVKPVGGEDNEELIQDALCVAAKMLHDLEARGKQVTPGNITYYTVLHMKSGRRSYSAGRTDTMGSGTQLDGKSCVLSFEEPAGIDSETGEEIPLGDLLAGHGDDPSMTATRTVDWEDFLNTHDRRYAGLVSDLAMGKNSVETAKKRRKSYFQIRKLREKLALELREYMGDRAIADAIRIPSWKGNITCDHEKALCRAERRH